MPWKETCTMEERLKLMLEWSDVETSVSELCRCYGVSRKTAYKWRERYLADGVPGLSDRSRAPRCHPRAMSAEVVTAVLGVRHTHPTWGPKKIRAYLERHRPGMGWPAVSSIGDLLRREGLVVIRRQAPAGTAADGPVCRLCGRQRRVVHRSQGLVPVWRRGALRSPDAGRCSEPLSVALPGPEADGRGARLAGSGGGRSGSLAWPCVLRSDNGPPFASVGAGGLSPFAVKVVKAGVVPERIDPGQPQQNGRLERLHGTIAQETASPPAPSLRAQGRRFAAFLRTYNDERPHEALGQTPPVDHYLCSPRRYSGRLREPEYSSGHEVRRVRHSGEIRWRGHCIYISESLAGEPVGLEEREDGDWNIHFGPVLLGRIDRQGRFHRPKRPTRRPKPVRG